jgi:hypothetical protein
VLSDSLSRDFHISSNKLSNLLSFHFPEQAPFGLRILQPPTESNSWLISLLCNQPLGEMWSKEPMPSKFALGLATVNTSSELNCKRTYTSTTLVGQRNSKSSVLVLNQSEGADFDLEQLKKY